MQTSEATAARPRIQSLSDLIFGLALSISALTLIGQQPSTTSQFAVAILLFGFSFMILINVWRLYSSVASILPSETSFLVDLNIVLLFLVSVEPYLFNELFVLKGGLLLYASSAYSVDLAAMFFIIAFFLYSLTKEEKHLVPERLLSRYKFLRNMTLLVALLLTLSIYPYFGDTVVTNWAYGGLSYQLSLREAFWLLALFLGWGRRLVELLQDRQSARAS